MTPAVPPMATSSSGVADLVLHPVVLVALVVLVANDHGAKARWPGTLTGKASDVVGLIVAPVVVAAVVLAVARLAGRRPRLDVVVAAAAAIVAVGFIAAKATAVGELAYEHGLGGLQWCVAAAWAAVTGGGVPGVRPVELVADRSDLVALPAVVVPLVLARGRVGRAGTAPAAAGTAPGLGAPGNDVSGRAGRWSRGRTGPGWR